MSLLTLACCLLLHWKILSKYVLYSVWVNIFYVTNQKMSKSCQKNLFRTFQNTYSGLQIKKILTFQNQNTNYEPPIANRHTRHASIFEGLKSNWQYRCKIFVLPCLIQKRMFCCASKPFVVPKMFLVVAQVLNVMWVIAQVQLNDTDFLSFYCSKALYIYETKHSFDIYRDLGASSFWTNLKFFPKHREFNGTFPEA